MTRRTRAGWSLLLLVVVIIVMLLRFSGAAGPLGRRRSSLPCQAGFCTENHRATKNNYLKGLDEYRKVGILTNGSGVVEPAGHHSRVEEASSQRSNKRRPEVDPIVRFFTSTG